MHYVNGWVFIFTGKKPQTKATTSRLTGAPKNSVKQQTTNSPMVHCFQHTSGATYDLNLCELYTRAYRERERASRHSAHSHSQSRHVSIFGWVTATNMCLESVVLYLCDGGPHVRQHESAIRMWIQFFASKSKSLELHSCSLIGDNLCKDTLLYYNKVVYHVMSKFF